MHPFVGHFIKARKRLGNNTTTAKILHSIIENSEESNYEIQKDIRLHLERLPPEIAQSILIQSYKRECQPDCLISEFSSLPTGSYLNCNNIISIEHINQMIKICDQYFCSERKPLRIKKAFQDLNAPIWDEQPWLKAIITSIAKILSTGGIFNDGIAIIQSRCLLRRTYPTNCSSYTSPFENNNNQTWHQDSNGLLNNRRMITIWIPLQPGAGKICPGISICNAKPDRFSNWLGDGCTWSELTSKYDEFILTESTPICSQGDAIVFDGLTYHQTYTSMQMQQHRDALLLRITEPQFIQYFPNADPLIIQN
jgi:hypothetical protein